MTGAPPPVAPPEHPLGPDPAPWDEDVAPDPLPALGAVADEGRGSLPYALLHGEGLVACAAWAMGEAGVRLVDLGTPWSAVVEAEEPFVLHDSLCPMTPPAFVAACVRAALDADRVVVGVQAVTDTVKQVGAGPGGDASSPGEVGNTVDRDGVWAVTSPLVLPPRVVRALAADPRVDRAGLAALSPELDLAALVSALAGDHDVLTREAPAEARRVHDTDDLEVLAALTDPGRG